MPTGDDNDNFLVGSGERDFIQGFGGTDSIFGLNASDTLDGGSGADVLFGGDGIDFVTYANSISVAVDLMNNSAAGGDANGDFFNSIECIIGSSQTDLLAGTDDTNIIQSGDGNDSIQGRGGFDILDGGNGDDTIKAGDSSDGLTGGAGADELDGGEGTQDIASYQFAPGAIIVDLTLGKGLAGDALGDTFTAIEGIHGSSFSDSITGSGRDEILVGGFENGTDTVLGLGGNDTVEGTGVISGGGGNDLVIGGEVAASLILGGGGRDSISGELFSDTIGGGDGNDFIDGGRGRNVMSGGHGADTFRFENGSNPSLSGDQNFILDFRQSEHDKLDFRIFDINLDNSQDDPFLFIGAHDFTGKAGQLRFVESVKNNATFLQGDFDGDRHADYQIKFTGLIDFVKGDLLL